VERYHSSDEARRGDYRDKVMALWNGDVRSLVMDAVLAENTNTPYHHALNSFAAAQYADALEKYRAIVDANPNDRLGLLGVAMSYEKLGQNAEADVAYSRYIAADPDDAAVLTVQIKNAKALPPAEARAKLELLVKVGVSWPELFAALSEVSAAAGDNEAAFSYAERALKGAPSVVHYQLNAGILADRLKKPAVAVQYYEDFLASAERQPNLIETPMSGIRNRVQFLRARM
jgi:tetratricopeptide (TPR) repeat protein